MQKKPYINLHALIIPFKKNLIMQLLHFFNNFFDFLEIFGKII